MGSLSCRAKEPGTIERPVHSERAQAALPIEQKTSVCGLWVYEFFLPEIEILHCLASAFRLVFGTLGILHGLAADPFRQPAERNIRYFVERAMPARRWRRSLMMFEVSGTQREPSPMPQATRRPVPISTAILPTSGKNIGAGDCRCPLDGLIGRVDDYFEDIKSRYPMSGFSTGVQPSTIREVEQTMCEKLGPVVYEELRTFARRSGRGSSVALTGIPSPPARYRYHRHRIRGGRADHLAVCLFRRRYRGNVRFGAALAAFRAADERSRTQHSSSASMTILDGISGYRRSARRSLPASVYPIPAGGKKGCADRHPVSGEQLFPANQGNAAALHRPDRVRH
ncbi:MAG: hypothetical protein R3C97_11545 [Geminicoccaceae bacterium]